MQEVLKDIFGPTEHLHNLGRWHSAVTGLVSFEDRVFVFLKFTLYLKIVKVCDWIIFNANMLN